MTDIDEKWPQKPDCTRDRLLHLLDVFEEVGDSFIITKQLDEVIITLPGVIVPGCALTVGDLRILADVAVGGHYALDGETGSEIEVQDA